MSIGTECPKCGARLFNHEKIQQQKLPCPVCGHVVLEQNLDAADEIVEVLELEDDEVLMPQPFTQFPLNSSRLPASTPDQVLPETAQRKKLPIPVLLGAVVAISLLSGLILTGVLGWLPSSLPQHQPEARQRIADNPELAQRSQQTLPPTVEAKPLASVPSDLAKPRQTNPASIPQKPIFRRRQTARAPMPNNALATSPGGEQSVEKIRAKSWADGLSREQVIDRVKKATVIVDVETNGVSVRDANGNVRSNRRVGSGFIITKLNRRGSVLTDAQLFDIRGMGKIEQVQLTLFSGTPDQLTVVSKEFQVSPQKGLALIRIDTEKLPEPISLSDAVKFEESQTVYAAGFPFGRGLSTSKKGPAVTIETGSISSIRSNDQQQIESIQLDGNIQPGGCGGPVFNQAGSIVGMASSGLFGTDIGFATPSQQIQRWLRGSITRLRLTGSKTSVTVSAVLDDPSNRIRGCEIFVFEKEKQTVHEPDAAGNWPLAAGEILKSHQDSSRRTVCKFHLSTNDQEKDLMMQMRVQRHGAPDTFTAPERMQFLWNRGPLDLVVRPIVGTNPGEVLSQDEGAFVIELPQSMRAFAINHQTGDIACVSASENTAFLIKNGDLQSAKLSKPPVTAPVCDLPSSIVYKQYEDRGFYIIGSHLDSEIHVLDAGDFSTVEKLTLSHSGTRTLAASREPSDPFVYFDSPDRSTINALNLRTMAEHVDIVDEAKRCVISPDGKWLYSLGKSKSLIAIDQLVTDFETNAPVFHALKRMNKKVPSLLVDPRGEFVFVDRSVYAKDFSSIPSVDWLGFHAKCVFQNRPLIIGFREKDFTVASKPTDISALSYNSMTSLSHRTTIPYALLKRPQTIDSRWAEASHSKYSNPWIHMLADDTGNRVILAAYNHLATIPVDRFGEVDERFLAANPQTTGMRVGKSESVTVAPNVPEAEVSFGELPSNVTADGKQITWTPTIQQIGVHRIPVSVKLPKTSKQCYLDVDVRLPAVSCPISIDDFLLSPTGKYAVCWGRTQVEPNQSSEQEMCVLPFASGMKPIRQTINLKIKQAVLFGHQLAVLEIEKPEMVTIFELRTLKVVKRLLLLDPVQQIKFVENELWLRGQKQTEVYDPRTFKRIRTQPPIVASVPDQEYLDGLLDDGVLRSRKDQSAMLVLEPGRIPVAVKGSQRLSNGPFLRISNAASKIDGPYNLGDRGHTVSLYQYDFTPKWIGLALIREYNRDIVAVLRNKSGDEIARFRAYRHTTASSQDLKPGHMRVVDNNVFISYGNELYRWQPNQDWLDSQQPKKGYLPSTKLHFTPKQSVFVVSKDAPQLIHRVVGGRPPYQFHLMTKSKGLVLDEQTGHVTIDRDKLVSEVLPLLPRALNLYRIPSGNLPILLRKRTIELSDEFVRLTGRKPSDSAVAHSIHLRATDQNRSEVEIQYYFFLELLASDFEHKFSQ